MHGARRWLARTVFFVNVPAFHVLRSASLTLLTQSVNCIIRVFSIIDMREDFIASSGVAGTLHTFFALSE